MQTLTSKQLAQDWLKHQHLRAEHPELFGLKSTGLIDLDNILGGGIELGQLVYLGGAQKAGKTTLLVKIARSFMQQGVRCLVLSAEMNNMQIGTLLFSNLSGIERTKIRRIGLDAHDWEELERVAKTIEKYPAHWNYGFADIGDIDKILDEVEAGGPHIEAVFVDYIQLMEAPSVKGGRSFEIEYISRALKRRSLNRAHPMAVIAAAQLNRESIRAKLVDANAFLGSGALERDMDIGVIIHDIQDPINNQPLSNVKEIVVVGSRETAVGSCQVYYNGSTASLENKANEEAKDLSYWMK